MKLTQGDREAFVTPVLDAARAYCYHSTPENREKLKQALEEYGNG